MPASSDEDSVSEYVASENEDASSAFEPDDADETPVDDESPSEDDVTEEDEDEDDSDTPKAKTKIKKVGPRTTAPKTEKRKQPALQPRAELNVEKLPYRRFYAGRPATAAHPAAKSIQDRTVLRVEDYHCRDFGALASATSPEHQYASLIDAWRSTTFSIESSKLERMNPFTSGFDAALQNDDGPSPPKRPKLSVDGSNLRIKLVPMPDEVDKGLNEKDLTPLQCFSLNEIYPHSQATMANVGHPITSVSWFHEESGSVATTKGGESLISTSAYQHCSLQIWAFQHHAKDKQASLELFPWQIYSTRRGGIRHIDWRPVDRHLTGERIVAILFEDGTLHTLPLNPRATKSSDTHYDLDAIDSHEFACSHSRITTFAWGSSDMLVAGTATGDVLAWRMSECTKNKRRPAYLSRIHQAAVIRIECVQQPSVHLNEPFQFDRSQGPFFVGSAAIDGSVMLHDLRDPQGVCTMEYERIVNEVLAYDHLNITLLSSTQETDIKSISLTPRFATSLRRKTLNILGSASALATSELHPLIAVGTSAGLCSLGNSTRGVFKTRAMMQVAWPLYRIEHDPDSDRIRVQNNFLPEVQGTTVATGKKKRGKDADDDQEGRDVSLGWPAQCTISALKWHPSKAHAECLASASVTGLLRIDCLPRQS